MAGQRTDYLSWDEYFMSIVSLASLRSDYGKRGACLVDTENRILSIGCNQAPYSVYDKIPGGLSNYVLSPVSNTLFTFKGRRSEFQGGTIYLSDFPNPDDARNLAQAKLQKIVYLNDIPESEDKEITNIILDAAKVERVPYIEGYPKEDYFDFLNELHSFLKEHLKKSDGPLSSEEYYMGIAVLSALRSKDPKTQVGSCLVDENGRVISVGYNGATYRMSDDLLPWHSSGEETGIKKDIKNPYVVHAEINVLDNYRGQQDDLNRMKLYLTFSPCGPCTERLSSVPLKEIVWLRTYEKLNPSYYANWFSKTDTDYHSYDSEIECTKQFYNEFFNETTKVIKKNIGKPGK
ncbi:MAG: hypothetical protein K2I72_02210, partial [Bacilli bacterium]|nr:hypothetical protein [Bacilli bacterium]